MKNIIIVVMVLIIVGGGIWFLLNSTPEPEELIMPEEAEEPEKVIVDEATDLKCEENDKYFVVLRESDPGVLDFIVKSKKSSDQIISCAYIVEEEDFELKNQQATYFLALTDNFLIFDRGTSPHRGLIVYSLAGHNEVYAGEYGGPLTVSNDTITYWALTDKEATIDNCPELNDFLNSGLGAAIYAYVSLDLSDLTKTELGEYMCSARQ